MERPDILVIRNGERAQPTFSEAEMSARLKRLRAHMADRAIDVALFTSYHNINYYGDYLYCGFGRPYGLVVDQDSQTLIAANVDGGQPWRRAFAETLTYTDWQRDNYVRAVCRLVKTGARVGVEFDHLSLQMHAKLRDALAGSEFVDIAEAAMTMRMVKSREEIDLIRNGARIADIGGAACVEAIEVGVPEYEVAMHATAAMTREIARLYPHVELRDSWTWLQSGLNTDGAHNPLTSRRIERGDILNLNCFPMIAGYYAALERTLFAEEASERHLDLWRINCEVHRRGLELIRPGVRCCDVAAELNEIYREHGLLEYRTFGYGHSFGVLCHYYGREAGLELREDVETVLEPNMVLSMEPMIMLPEGMEGAGGYREHDILVVTEEGNENLTRFPIGPDHNIIRK